MGFFSWKTQDTNKSISNTYSSRGTFTVHMVNPITEEVYTEDCYEGYGVFGGKDFYELVAEMNGHGSDRIKGIDLAFSGGTIETPVLVENLGTWQNYVGVSPERCKYQGYFYYDEEE